MNKRKTIICIDSFKLDYLKHAPYLSSLTKKYQHGRLYFPLGFWGGMETFFTGSSKILAFYYFSKDSSLKWTKRFVWLGKLPLNCMINFIRLLRREELFFTYNIPLNKLWMFDTAVKKPLHRRLNINYIHFGRLDRIAHKYGTTSDKTIACIKRIDKKLSKMKFDLLMSDHGMVDVKEIIKVPESRICFLDGTLARYWGSKAELDGIKKKLPLNKGKIITWPDKSYGELIFLANPGMLILPNYWQGKNPCKGMHGYSPSCKETQGFYIIKQEGKRKDLKISELKNLLKQSCLIC
jgi:predicted AlkP superfamily pyrophosphatase or phosphodiesterase